MSLHTAPNPFVGLRPFESDESLLFFGRQEQTVELLQRLHQHHFVAIIGNSGCGKSSLIRGGLIPRLKAGYLIDGQDRWMITMMKPGQSPLHNLAEAILNQINPESESQVVNILVKKIKEEGADVLLDILRPLWEQHSINFFLLIDQFEELFRFSMNQKEVEKKDEAIDFVNIMLELSRQPDLPVYVVMTMRSDFIGDCAQFYGLPEAMNRSQYLIPRLSRINLKNAIEGPVKLYGSNIDPALTSRLLNDVVVLKDELPLLQHALMRMWDHEINVNKSGELDLEDYESIGGMEKALSDHADEALKGMSENELALTKKIFQSLTIIDENGRKVRRPVLVSELEALTGESKEKLMEIIIRFSEEKKSFLIISKAGSANEELIDISHESLIRQWNTLAAWSDEEAASAKIYLHLKESAELYRERKKDLLEGSEFQIAMQWYKTFDPSPVWARRYNDGFEDSIQYLLESEKHQKSSERRNKRFRRNRLILIFTSVIFLLIALSFFILKQRLQIIKEAFRLNSLAQEQVIDDPTVALRIGQAANEIYADSTIQIVSENIYRNYAFYKTLIRDSFEYPSIAVSDSSILTGSIGGNAKLWSIDGRLIKEFKGNNGTVWAVAFSPDKKKVLTGTSDGIAILWDLDGNKLQEFKGHTDWIRAVAFSPKGTEVLTGSKDNTVILWDMEGKPIHAYKKHRGAVRSVAFSPDGKKIISGSEDSTAILWRVKDGKILYEFTQHKGVIGSVVFSSDGQRILTGSYDRKAILWDLNGKNLQEFNGHIGDVISATFSPGDESRILTASYDGTARLWSIEGEVLKVFRGHTDKLRAAAFLPGGNSIVTTHSEKMVRVWSLGKSFPRGFDGHKDSVVSVAFSPDGKKILTGSADSVARLWDLNDSVVTKFKGNEGTINALAFSKDGSKIVICSGKTPELITIGEGKIVKLTGHTGRINSITFSHKGDKILTGSSDGTARLWLYPSGSALNQIPIKSDGSTILAAAFSPDGNKVFIANAKKRILICSTDGTVEKDKSLDDDKISLISVAFSPDGTKVAAGYEDGSIGILSIDDKDAVITKFKGHEKTVYSVAFSDDGQRIISGSKDQLIKVWSVKGVFLSVLTGHSDCVLSVAFSKDGKKMISGSENKEVKVWNSMPLDEFLKNNLIDELTIEQKKSFGIK